MFKNFQRFLFHIRGTLTQKQMYATGSINKKLLNHGMLITTKTYNYHFILFTKKQKMQLIQIRQQEEGEKGITCKTTVFQTTSTYFEKR